METSVRNISIRFTQTVLVTLSLMTLVGCWGTFGDLDINRLVATSPLVVEGIVADQSPGMADDVSYTVYELKIDKVWKGASAERVLVTVPDRRGGVQLRPGERYLLFLRDSALDGQVWEGPWYLNASSHVWNIRSDTFRVTNPGGACCLNPITRTELAEVIERNAD